MPSYDASNNMTRLSERAAIAGEPLMVLLQVILKLYSSLSPLYRFIAPWNIGVGLINIRIHYICVSEGSYFKF